jgi:hypothetical protein
VPGDDGEAGTWSELQALLRRIDGWGPGVWREAVGWWRVDDGWIALEEVDAVLRQDPVPTVDLVVSWPVQQVPAAVTQWPLPACDVLLRDLWARVFAPSPLGLTGQRPTAAVRAGNGCAVLGGRLVARARLRLPLAGLCVDTPPLLRLLRATRRWLRSLRSPPPPLAKALHAGVRCWRRQQALRAVLHEQNWAAFLADGAILPRDRDDGPLPGAAPLRVPAKLATTVDLGALGRVRGWAIGAGVTVLIGAPYHGKSTVLRALAAGIVDHAPGDGRELVLTRADATPLLADEGRRLKRTDLSPFLRHLPGGSAKDFSTVAASGATALAGGLQQALAAGCRTLLIDEDTAAANILSVEPAMARLLGPALRGLQPLCTRLRHLADAGVAVVLVAGGSAAALPAADAVVELRDFQPRWRQERRHRRGVPFPLPRRHLRDEPETLFRNSHAPPISVAETERPRLWDETVDLRRCGLVLDGVLARSALLGACWACRMSDGDADLADLARRWHTHVAIHGAAGLDPFASGPCVVPPWPLVVMVLERLSRPVLQPG